MSYQPEEYRKPPKVGPTISPEPDPETADTNLLATLITQLLSGGSLTAPTPETTFLAQMIKGQGWQRCQCKDGCCR